MRLCGSEICLVFQIPAGSPEKESGMPYLHSRCALYGPESRLGSSVLFPNTPGTMVVINHICAVRIPDINVHVRLDKSS